ncbi:acetylxylan esterase [Propionibacteriaceae bacterium Y1923]|uniref:acetylxylan esterase n=1 Tax=Aestuariimicrobium sp. Y1814 TaxID=3418742 RepID=UPI003C145065
MALFDLPLDELRTYRPDFAEPADFEEFWQATIDEAAQVDLGVRVEPFDNRQKLVDAYDVTFAGWGGAPIRAWYIAPTGTSAPLSVVVSFAGYAGGRHLPFASPFVGAGHAQLIMDTRGQGWSQPSVFERTADPDPSAGESAWPGLMTRGIASPQTYYYRRLYIDCLRAVQVAKTLPRADPSGVFVQGASQGGGMAIAAAGLAAMADVSLAGAMVDVPFLCHFGRAVTLTDAGPYQEISHHLRSHPADEQSVLQVLNYFDGVHLAKRTDIPAIFSVGLMDQVCPPSTVFAAYNAWGSSHEEASESVIKVYSHAGHEGGAAVQTWEQLAWLEALSED